jgi:hypothetical protein
LLLGAAALSAVGLLVASSGDAGAKGQGVVAAAPVDVTAMRFASARQLRLRTPPKAAAGDLLVAALTIRAGSNARIWKPPGWTHVRRDSCAGPEGVTLTQALYARIATDRQAEWTGWGLRRATSAVGGVVAYRGLDRVKPILDTSGAGRRNVSRVLAPSVRAPAAQTLVVGFYGHTGSQPDTLPSGTALRLDIGIRRVSRSASMKIGDFTARRAGETGRRVTRLQGRAACSIGQQLALRPLGVRVFPGAPVNTAPPTIAGTAAVGQRLTVSPGTWTGSPSSVAYQWRRCSAAGEACADIAGATGTSHVAVPADAGHRLRVAVVASNTAGPGSALSAATAVVAGSGGGGSPPPPPPPPPPIPIPPPLPPPAGSVVVVDRTWTCEGPVNIPLVRVTMHANADAIHLRENCSGRIGRIEVDTWTLDGLKVNAPAPAAHDLVIEGGYIRCHDSTPDAHQDGIQAMGGTRVRFVGLELNCNSGPNAQLFIAAANGGRPTDIVCDGCFLGSGAGSSLFIATSTRSGAVNTLICPGRFSPIRIQGATEPVNVSNTVLPASDARC